MSYTDWFGSYRDKAEQRLYAYIRKPEKLSAENIPMYDGMAAQRIADAQKLIADLTEYRQALAARYAELQIMPYRRVLRVKRWKSDNVSYYVTICREYEDGTRTEELRESYSGKDRHTALKRFEELKKQNPGIEAEKDIAKSKWEH